MIDDCFRQAAKDCIAAGVRRAAGGVVDSGHLLDGIVDCFDTLASRALWELGYRECTAGLERIPEVGSPGEFSKQAKAILTESLILAEETALVPISRSDLRSDERARPAHLVVVALRLDCQASRRLREGGITEESFVEKLGLLYTPAMGEDYFVISDSEFALEYEEGARLVVLAQAIPYAAELIRESMPADSLDESGRHALSSFNQAVAALSEFFAEHYHDAPVEAFRFDPSSGIAKKHDPRNYLAIAVQHLRELERDVKRLPRNVKAESRDARLSAVRLHDGLTLSR